MIKSNKLINSILLQKAFLLATIVPLTSGACIYIAQEKTPKSIDVQQKNIFLLGVIALLTISAVAEICSDYKKTKKFLSLVARKYLKKELGKHPELKQFEKNLDNPQAMQDVSNLIFNSLRPSERKRIAQIISETTKNLRDHKKYDVEDTNPLKTSKIVINDARNAIIAIIKEHISVHPEFIDNIYSVMANADMVYVMKNNSIKQNIR